MVDEKRVSKDGKPRFTTLFAFCASAIVMALAAAFALGGCPQ